MLGIKIIAYVKLKYCEKLEVSTEYLQLLTTVQKAYWKYVSTNYDNKGFLQLQKFKEVLNTHT